jgi:transcriptional regulator with XRE-family HTH domain
MSRSETSQARKSQGLVFRERMKARRVEMNLTQKDLASKSNISVELVQAIEGGRSSNPSFFIALDIMRALEINIGEVATWAGIQS